MSDVDAASRSRISQRTLSARACALAFFGVSALVLAASAAATVWCGSSAMGDMPMPGGWTMSMTWMRMCGQKWVSVAASFLCMWVVMMIAMMLPSLTPTLWRYYQVAGEIDAACRARLTALVGLGYFAVWAALGAAVFPLGAALAALEMQLPVLARTVPPVAAIVVMICGALEFSAWKAHQLACCREAPRWDRTSAPHASAAWRHGLRFGLRCSICCAGLTTMLLVVGIMDLRAMGAVTAAITAERLAPRGERVARAIGIALIGAGLCMLAQAAGIQ